MTRTWSEIDWGQNFRPLDEGVSGSSPEELNRASTEACGASFPLKFVVSMSNPKIVPEVPSFKMDQS